MKKVTVLLILLGLGCTPEPEPIRESEVVRTIEGFFEALDAENTNPDLLDAYVTPDFIIYEASQKMDLEQFKAFVKGSSAVETNWELDDFRISIDENSAHASFFNRGDFVVQDDSARLRLQIQWLESAYLVKQNDSLKIKFYFSDNIGVKTDTIP